MAFDISIQQEKINKLKDAFEKGRFADALLAALNTGNGLMQQRIFQQTTDVEGNDFGAYIGKATKVKRIKISKNPLQNKRNKALIGQNLTPYQRKRASKGRQVLRKDLEFTGGLRRAIETIVENDKAVVLEFNNDQAALIAKGQEAQITNIRLGQKGITKGVGIKIFSLNQAEKQEVTEQGRELITQILKP
jgi:hypothetical protein